MRRKDGFTIPLVVVLLVILLVAAGVAYVFLGTDLLSNPKSQFLKYISENKSILEELKQDELLEKYNRKLKSTPYTSEGTLTLTDNFKDESINYEDMLKLKNTSIHFTGSTDKVNSYDYKNIKVVYSDTTDMTYEYINYNDFYGIKSGDIVTKFIAIENNNLSDLAKKFGIEEESILSSIPAKLELSRYDYSKIFTDEEIETIKTNYQSVILENLTDDMFSKSDNVGDKIYTLKITDTQLIKIISDLLNKLQSDELILNKIKKTMINDFGLSENDSSEYIAKAQEYIKNSIESIKKEDNTSSNGEFLINVHVNNKKLVKTEIVRSDKKITIIKTDLGFSFEYTYESNKGFLVNFEKTSSADIIKYLISVSIDGNRIFNYETNISGLSTLSKVLETFDVSINFNEYKLGYRFEGSNEFLASIDKTITSQDILSINTAPNKEAIESLFTQIVQKFNEVSTKKKAESGLASLENDPIIYYAPGALPFELMNILTKMEYGEYVVPFGCLAGVGAYSIINNVTNVYDNATDTIDNSGINNQSVETFNSMWDIYAGEGKTSTEVTTLIDAIATSNKAEYASNSENPRLISVTYSSALGETNTYTNTDDIKKITPSADHKYNINIVKDDSGIVNSIVIIEF